MRGGGCTEKLIVKVSDAIKNELKLPAEKAEVVEYGVAVFLSTISGWVLIIGIAWLLGVVKLALAAAITTAGLRVISGGAHSENIRNCSLLGAVVSPGIGLFAKTVSTYINHSVYVLLAVTIWALTLWMVYRYAPADTPNKPITDEKFRKRLRVMSVVYLCCWLFIVIGALSGSLLQVGTDIILSSTLGLTWQAFSLSPYGYKLVDGVDRLLP